jgi:hypothetical protein
VAKRRARPEVARKSRGRILPLELSLIGSSDGVPFELTEHGWIDVGASRLTVEVGVARSLLLFDPALVAISLMDVLALAALGPRAAPDSDADSPAYVRSRTDLYDENGRDAGGWRIVAHLEHTRGDGLRLDGQVLDCSQRIEPGERMVAVDSPWTVLAHPLKPEGVLLSGAWGARTRRGNGYRGVTVATVDGWPRVRQVLRIRFDGICIRRAEIVRAGETIGIDATLATVLHRMAPM